MTHQQVGEVGQHFRVQASLGAPQPIVVITVVHLENMRDTVFGQNVGEPLRGFWNVRVLVDESGVERLLAVERMRAEAMAMRSSKDLWRL